MPDPLWVTQSFLFNQVRNVTLTLLDFHVTISINLHSFLNCLLSGGFFYCGASNHKQGNLIIEMVSLLNQELI